ncbi:helix-turn-helix domain-containing protein [Pseudomonas sp. A2]|uniref:helix-turn-helix domain-containing protein n=1 Tax=Pseudomonas sp. A2 TaxID=107445 RepID=UPI003A7F5A8C
MPNRLSTRCNWWGDGKPVSQIASLLGVHRSTLYRSLNRSMPELPTRVECAREVYD